MRPKTSLRLLAVTTTTLLFGVVTDQVSSHKLSSLAVSAFNSAAGTMIELVTPEAPQAAAKGQPRRSAHAASPSTSTLQESAVAAAAPIGAPTESDPPDLAPLEPLVIESVTSSRSERGTNLSSGNGWSRPSSFGGAVRGSTRESASEAPQSEAVLESRLESLMDLVVSDLVGEYPTISFGASSSQTGTSAGSDSSRVTGPSLGGATSPGAPSSASSTPSPSTSSGPGQNSTGPPSTDGPVDTPSQQAPSHPAPPAASAPSQDAPASPSDGVDPFVSASDSDPSQSPTDLIEQLIPDLGQVAPVVPPTPTFTDPDNTGLVLDVTPLVSAPPTISEPTVSLFPPAPVLDTPNAGLDTPTIVNPEPGTLLLFGSGLALAANRAK